MIKVLIADDEEVFREGLAKLLTSQPHIEVVSHCGTAGEAIIKARETGPDVILINSQMSEHDLMDTLKQMLAHSPAVKVAVIGRPDAGSQTLRFLRAGATAYLAKSVSASDLVKSIELISTGRIIISPVFAGQFLDEIASADVSAPGSAQGNPILSPREMEVVTLIVQGSSNKEIAGRLFISENTVKVHVKNILNKLELRNRQQLVAYAVVRNWVTTMEEKTEGEST